jgi:PAS domain S-box-containing protein
LIIDGEPVEEFETTIQTREGAERIMSWYAHPITDRDGTLAGSVAVGRDVTDRKQMKQRFQTLIGNLPGVVYRCRNEPGWPMEFVGGDCESLTGYTAEQLESGDVQWEESLTHPDDKEKVRAEVAQALEADEPFEVRYRIQTADGDQRWMWERGRKVPAPADSESELLEGFVTEITERKQYERRLEEQRNNLKLLNKVLRHDIRNDLQVVTLYAELLESEIDDEQQEYITRLITNAEHATNLTETARVMADVMLERERDREDIDLKRVLESELEEARLRSDDAAVAVEGSLPSVTVRADEMLHSVFANLLKNAIQHNDKERPEVTVSLTEYSDSAVVEVADNGPGITAERKTAIFGEGEKGLDSEGTGIGLYLVRTLVEDYGGTIRVEDNAPTGAVFVVELPRAD